jgi:hypothetical protein
MMIASTHRTIETVSNGTSWEPMQRRSLGPELEHGRGELP